MRNRILSLILCYFAFTNVYAQTKIKDGTVASSALPNTNAILELESNNKGFLMPRVALTSTSSASPLSAHVAGITVYNTTTNANVVPGIYCNDGTKWVAIVTSATTPVNLYNSNGTLTNNREVTLDAKSLTFRGATGRLTVDGNGRSVYLYSTGNNSTLLRFSGEDLNENGVNATVDMQLFADANFQMLAVGDVGLATFGTHNSSNPSHLRFVTSPGSGTTGQERMRITGTGNIGIGTSSPTEQLDIASGNVRIRNINANNGSGSDNLVVADANGVLKTLSPGAYTLFHARLAATQNLTANTMATLLYQAPLATSSLYSYNTGTGVLTFTQPGNYLVTMQASFSSLTTTGHQLTVGIRPVPDADYLARGSHFNGGVPSSSTVGDLMTYTTMLVVPSAGYQVRFVTITNTNCTVLATETGASGSGNVTNITIQKI